MHNFRPQCAVIAPLLLLTGFSIAQVELPSGYTEPKCGFRNKDPMLQPGDTPDLYQSICTAKCFCVSNELPFVPKNSLLCSSTTSREAAFDRSAFQRCRAGCTCGDAVAGEEPGTLFVVDRNYEEDWWAFKALEGRKLPGPSDADLQGQYLQSLQQPQAYPWGLCRSMSECGSQALAAAGFVWSCVITYGPRTLVGAGTAAVLLGQCRQQGMNIPPVDAAIVNGLFTAGGWVTGGIIPVVTSYWWAIKRKLGRPYRAIVAAAGGAVNDPRLGGETKPVRLGLEGRPTGNVAGLSKLVPGENGGRKRSVEEDAEGQGEGEEADETEEARMVRLIHEWEAQEKESLEEGLKVCACNATYISRGCCSAGRDGIVWEAASERVEGEWLHGSSEL